MLCKGIVLISETTLNTQKVKITMWAFSVRKVFEVPEIAGKLGGSLVGGWGILTNQMSY